MTIQTSNIIEDSVQIDGRRNVREKHTDHLSREKSVSYLAEAGTNEVTEMNNRIPLLDAELRLDEKQRAVAHVLKGNSIQTFSFVDVTLKQGARFVLRYMHSLEDPRPAKSYAQQVVDAGATTVSNVLDITIGAATKLVTWAQGVIDSLNDADAAKINADDAISEIGGT